MRPFLDKKLPRTSTRTRTRTRAKRFSFVLVLVLVLETIALAAPPVLEAPGVRVAYGSERDAAPARRTAEVVRAIEVEVSARLGVHPPLPIDVELAENDAAFDRAFERILGRRALSASKPFAWALAVAIPDAGAILIRAYRLEALTDNDLRSTLAHEIAHLAVAQAGPLPRWLDEGLAQWAAGRKLTTAEKTLLERLARAGDLPSLADLERGFPPHAEQAQLAYVASAAFVEALVAASGPEAIPALLRRVAEGRPLARAFESTFDAPLRGFELAWRSDLASRYSLLRDLFERGSLFTVAAILVVVAFVRYRRRRARRLEDMGDGPPLEYNPATGNTGERDP